MSRFTKSATALLVLVLAGAADEKPKAKGLAADVERLNGTWVGPKTSLAPGTTGPLVLKFEFEKDATTGRATFLTFFSKSGVLMKTGPSFDAEVAEKGKKRVIVLTETVKGKRTEIGEIAFEVKGDGLRLAAKKKVFAEKGGHALELGGDYVRKRAEKK